MVGLAWTLVAHTDSRFDPVALQRFVLAFQREQPLLISELWAVPIALRLTLVENLRRLAEEIVEGRADRLAADRLARFHLQTRVTSDADDLLVRCRNCDHIEDPNEH